MNDWGKSREIAGGPHVCVQVAGEVHFDEEPPFSPSPFCRVRQTGLPLRGGVRVTSLVRQYLSIAPSFR
jgi:hypothetical protein